MARAQRDARELLCVAGSTQASVGRSERKSVRLVALRTRDAFVKVLVSVGGLVATAARQSRVERLAHDRMRLMTTRATTLHAEARVVRVNVRVTRRAGLFWAPAHVVRRVAACALLVSQHGRLSEHVNLGVTRAAG
jgi:hypothetical protein